ncbi:MAG: UDP-N-acetylglucosamine 2-epimerase (hydrolyzing) [Desulfomonile tiedjei]|nr:UDP-N-acetylglucosamine 2-epimerase (hydrolyzing) [Desulfomonile tiedjei]
MRTIGVVTGARADYGMCASLLERVDADPTLDLHVLVTGMHLSPEFGMTARWIEQDGYRIGDKIEMLLSSDSPVGTAKSVGLGIIGFAQSFSRFRPDILVVLGDRFEMYAAVVAALPFGIPVAHLHGGEVTVGAIDDALRHSLTKLSHLHFVSTEAHARRVIQMGEEPWRVTVCGAPALDNLKRIALLSQEELEQRFGLSLEKAPLLVTYHPVTLEYEHTEEQVTELLAALHEWGMPVVFTMPNADTSGRLIGSLIRDFVEQHPSARVVDNLGNEGYFSMMAMAAAMVGNSSSGIVEAASFKLPVINIGTRQTGRERPANVVDVGYDRMAILTGLRTVCAPGFRSGLEHLKNPYHVSNASEIIAERLKTVALDQKLLMKRFFDLEGVLPMAGEEVP